MKPSRQGDSSGAPDTSFRCLQGRGHRALALVLLCIGAGLFVVRGPLRAVAQNSMTDYSGLYGPARAFWQGENAWSRDNCLRALREADAPLLENGEPRFTASLYPPSTYLLLGIASWLPWGSSSTLWALLSTATAIVIMLCLVRWAGLTIRSPQGLVLLGLFLCLAPFHTALRLGQMSPAAVFFAVFGLRLALGKPRDAWFGGLLMGISVALKPQIGLPFLAYLVVRCRWRSAFGALIALAVLNLLACIWTAQHGVALSEAWGSFQEGLSSATAAGGGVRFTRTYGSRGNLTNLHVLLHSFTDHIPPVQWCVPAVLGVVGIYYLRLLFTRAVRPDNELGWAAIPAIAGLLIMYHRAYDAIVICIPLAYLFSPVHGKGSRRAAWAGVACVVPFLFVPWPALFVILAKRDLLPAAVVESLLWQVLVVPVYSLVLMGLMGVCLWTLSRLPVAPRMPDQHHRRNTICQS